MYQSDGGENPGLFTVVGILFALLLGAGVFILLYSALAPQDSASGGVLPPLVLVTQTPSDQPGETTPAAPATVAGTPAATPVVTPVVTIASASPTAEATGTEQAAVTPSPAVARATGTPTTRPTPPPVITFRVASNGLGLNVRRMPSLTSGILERLPDGSTVRGLGQTRRAGGVQWRRVRTSTDTTGWASADVLQPAP